MYDKLHILQIAHRLVHELQAFSSIIGDAVCIRFLAWNRLKREVLLGTVALWGRCGRPAQDTLKLTAQTLAIALAFSIPKTRLKFFALAAS